MLFDAAMPALQVVGLIALGFFLRRVFGRRLRNGLTNLVGYVTLPALAFVNVMQIELTALGNFFFVSLAALMVVFGCLGLSLLYVRRARGMDSEAKGALILLATFHNSAFLPFPLILFYYGSLAAAVIYSTLQSLLFYFLSPFIASRFSPLAAASKLALVKSALDFPPIYAVGLALVLLALGVRLEAATQAVLSAVGLPTVYLGLLLLGLSLPAHLTFSAHRREIAFLTLVCLAFSPALGFVAIDLGRLTGIFRGTVIVQSFMPPAVNNILYILRYRLDSAIGSQATFTVTLMSLAAVNLAVALWG